MNLVSVDPGKHSVAWAVFEDDRLESVGWIECSDRVQLSYNIDFHFDGLFQKEYSAIIELPQVYNQRHWKGDPNDLIQVAVTAGMVAQVIGCTKFVLPHTWKGSRKKEIDNKVTLDALNSRERAELDRHKFTKEAKHNVIDAIGIGLWKVGRR